MSKLTKEEIKQRQRQSGIDHAENITKYTLDKRSPEEQLEIRRKAQKAQQETLKKRKDIKTICNELLSLSAADMASGYISPELQEKINNSGLNITLYDLILAKQIEKAIAEGNTKAAEYIRDSAGDKPTDKIQSDINVITEADQLLLSQLNDRLNVLEGLENGAIIANNNQE